MDASRYPEVRMLGVGSFGPEVRRAQEALRMRGEYTGPIDGIFGGGTAAAVRLFQSAAGLAVTGTIDDATRRELLGPQGTAPPAVSTAAPLAGQPLATRCLALTASFETSAPPPECFAGVVGDFDGQGISFGALQWNLGQGSLQPLLRALDHDAPEAIDAAFGAHAAELRDVLTQSRTEQLAWARSIQTPGKRRLHEPWHGQFKALGRTSECRAAQTRAAQGLFEEARGWCGDFDIHSERAVALMFDVRVQNGSISRDTRRLIEREFDAIVADGPAAMEVARLEVIAHRRADAARAPFREDVRARKLTIARGQGVVHGRAHDLAGQYAITLESVV